MQLSGIAWFLVALAAANIAVRGSLLGVLFKKTRRYEFAIFSTYIAFGTIIMVVGLAGYLFAGCNQYFYLSWVLGFLYVALEFGLMYEIFVNALKPYSALIDLGRMLFGWATAFLLIAATLTAFASAGSGADKITAAMSVIERTMRLIECGLLFLFFLFENRLKLSWRGANVGIALGLGGSAALDLALSYFKTRFPWRIEQFDVINSIAFLGVLCFWTYCVSSKKEKISVLESPNRLIFQRWNEALLSYKEGELAFASGRVDSFLPGVERTVERVLARKMVN